MNWCGATILVAAAVTATTVVAAATEIRTKPRACATPNCFATVVQGTVGRTERSGGFLNNSVPFVVQVQAGPKECLRLEVIAQSADLEMVVLSPKPGRVWRNDNSKAAGCKTCPLLKIVTEADEQGWFTVQIGTPPGFGSQSSFSLSYGRYAAANPNCAKPSRVLPPPG